MPFWENMPYTNFHGTNQDWIIETMKKLVQEWADYGDNLQKAYDAFTASVNEKIADLNGDWTDYKDKMNAAFADLHDYVYNYFDNLDVQDEIDHKLDEMTAQGLWDDILHSFFDSYTAQIDRIVDHQNSAIADQIGKIDLMRTELDTFLQTHGTVSATLRHVDSLWTGSVTTSDPITLSGLLSDYDRIEVRVTAWGQNSLQTFKPSDFFTKTGASFRTTNQSDGALSPAILSAVEVNIKAADHEEGVEVTNDVITATFNWWRWHGAVDDEGFQSLGNSSLRLREINGIKYTDISAEKDPELTDIRVGADGTVYPTAGDAVRDQFSNVLNTVDEIIEPIQLSNIVNKRPSDNNIIVMRNNGTLTGSETAPSLLGQQTYSYLGLAANNKNSGIFFAKITLTNIGNVNAPNLRTYVGYNNSPASSSSSQTFGTDIGDTFSLDAGESTTIYHRFSSEYNTSSYTGIAFGVLFGTVGITIQISGIIADITDYENFSDEVLKTVVDNENLKGYGLLLPSPNSEKLGDKTLQEVLTLARQSNNDYSLIAYGDSLTAGSGGSGVGYRYLDICKTDLGAKNDLPLGYGGSGSKAIGFTAGAISGFIPPNTRSFALKYSDLTTDISIANTRLNGKAVIIDGNEYIIGQTGATSYSLPETYTPASFYNDIVVKDSRYTADIYIIWVGTNDHEMKWDIINAFIEKLPHKQYVIMGLTKIGTDTSIQDETKAEELYGSHFFNTRVQIINNAFSVLDITPTAEDTTAISSGLMPPSLLSDETHFNNNGYRAIGKLLAQHIKALGYSYQKAN